MEGNKCQWYVSMEEYLAIVTNVIQNSSNNDINTGLNIYENRHPEDLMFTLQSVAETVALTLVALDQIGWVNSPPQKKKKK